MRRFGIEWLALKEHRKIYEDLFEHIKRTSEAVSLLVTGVPDLCEKNYEPLDSIVERVLELERAADEIARRTMDDLAVSVLTPVDRGDLMNLVFQVEKIAAEAEGLAYRLERAKALQVDVPADIAERLTEVAQDVARTVNMLSDAINELPSSLETAAKHGNEVSELEEKVDVDRGISGGDRR
jgi:predicted phosphate transport protein (TIGR00153 family)